MAVKELLTIEDEDQARQLRVPSLDVKEDVLSQVQNLFEDLLDTSKSLGGLGLAAPQIGVPLRVFVMEPRNSHEEPRIVVNPRVIAGSGKITSHGEGCLSVPGQRFEIKRARNIVIDCLDSEGKRQRIKARNKMEAIVIQHELDHLDGVLVCDRDGKSSD